MVTDKCDVLDWWRRFHTGIDCLFTHRQPIHNIIHCSLLPGSWLNLVGHLGHRWWRGMATRRKRLQRDEEAEADCQFHRLVLHLAINGTSAELRFASHAPRRKPAPWRTHWWRLLHDATTCLPPMHSKPAREFRRAL